MGGPQPCHPKAGAARLFETGDDHSQSMVETPVKIVELHSACLLRQWEPVTINPPGPTFDLVSGIPLARQRTHSLLLDSETDHVAVRRPPGAYGVWQRKPAATFLSIMASGDLQVEVEEIRLTDAAAAWVRPNSGRRVVLRVMCRAMYSASRPTPPTSDEASELRKNKPMK